MVAVAFEQLTSLAVRSCGIEPRDERAVGSQHFESSRYAQAAVCEDDVRLCGAQAKKRRARELKRGCPGVGGELSVVCRDRRGEAPGIHAESSCEFLKRWCREIDIAARAPVIVQVGVGNARRRRDEVRPLPELRRDALIHDDVAQAAGRARSAQVRIDARAIDQPTVAIDQCSAFAKQACIGREGGRQELHHHRAQQRGREILVAPPHQARHDAPCRQASQQSFACRRHEAQERAAHVIAIEHLAARRKPEANALAGGERVDRIGHGRLG